jgi:L-asparaginase II
VTPTDSTIDVVRGRVVESRHHVHVVVCDAAGATVALSGDPERLTYYRSAAKPFQALPLVEEGVADRLGMTEAELALCCASHQGEPEHVEGARSILARAGVAESALRCGAHPPFSERDARALVAAGEEPAPIHNNCSGKHAGMLALAVGMGWDAEDYHLPAHPVQRRMSSEIARWSSVPAERIRTGVDGCGVVCFAVPLAAIAGSFARFAAGAASGVPGPARVVRAMTEHPFMVGGTDRACTEVMRVGAGRVFVKLGAEGVYGGGVPEKGLGFAIKVVDGARRAVEAALIATLREIGIFDAQEVDALRSFGAPEVRNTRGDTVGEIRATIALAHRAHADR